MNPIDEAQRLGIEFRRFHAARAREIHSTIEEIYEYSYTEAIARGRPCDTLESFMGRFERHAEISGLDLVVAYCNGEPIGQIWGWPLQENTREWDGLTPEPSEEFVSEDGTRTFAIAEIMVVDKWKRRGVAHALHDFLLATRQERRATLFVEPENIPAQHAYRKWGWFKVGQLQPTWEGAPLFDVMLIDL
jgi:GNAT superfamily N-acetyltransferase